MRFARSTRLAQRRSQRTRQQVAAHAEQDFYDCPRCHNLFLRYHGSHKRHIRSCIAKHEAQVQKEARSRAERVATPTPEPYTPTITDAEMDNEDTSIGVQIVTRMIIDAHTYLSRTSREPPGQRRPTKLLPALFTNDGSW